MGSHLLSEQATAIGYLLSALEGFIGGVLNAVPKTFYHLVPILTFPDLLQELRMSFSSSAK